MVGDPTNIVIFIAGQISIFPKPECFGDFGGYSLTKPPFEVTSAEVVIICPDIGNPITPLNPKTFGLILALLETALHCAVKQWVL